MLRRNRLAKQHVRRSRAQPQGLLGWLWKRWRGTAEILVRPANELPQVMITYAKDEQEGAQELKAALTETWLTIPAELRARYTSVLERMPAVVVVEVRRRNPCGCLGHFHPAGTESEVTWRLRKESGVDVCEVDLAFEAIRAWQPAPLAYTAASEAAGAEALAEFDLFRLRLALLDVFLHELHHRAHPDDHEHEVRGKSGNFYRAALDVFTKDHFGVEYGL